MLSKLECEKFLEGAKQDLKDPIFEISLKGNKDYRLSIFNKQEKETEEYPAVSSENSYPFLLSIRQADTIIKDPETFLVKPST